MNMLKPILTAVNTAGGFSMKYALCYSHESDADFYSVFLSVSGADYYDWIFVPELTTDKTVAMRIIKKLRDGAVTPMTALDVIEDMIL